MKRGIGPDDPRTALEQRQRQPPRRRRAAAKAKAVAAAANDVRALGDGARQPDVVNIASSDEDNEVMDGAPAAPAVQQRLEVVEVLARQCQAVIQPAQEFPVSRACHVFDIST